MKDSELLPVGSLNGSDLRILIVRTRWNHEVVSSLVEGAKKNLIEVHKVKPENIVVETVPGAYELPFAAKKLIELSKSRAGGANLLEGSISSPATTAATRPFDAAICVGVLIKGDTMHFEYVCDAATQGILRVGLDTGVPAIFGVLTCLNEAQAWSRARADKDSVNLGELWGDAAVEMALLHTRQF